ncbi:MAG: hypothetical protein IJR14_07495, partial [Synergistaceae bacterium]|nr:hypothetical protein [Synergistaceae bacterium]
EREAAEAQAQAQAQMMQEAQAMAQAAPQVSGAARDMAETPLPGGEDMLSAMAGMIGGAEDGMEA